MGADAERLETSCRAACEAAASGELMEMLETLDPDVRWVGVDGEMRGAGVDAVASVAGDRRAEGVFDAIRLEAWRQVRDHVAVVVRLAHGRRRAFLLHLRGDRIAEIRDCASPAAAYARLPNESCRR
jgi:hypothetical protein